MSDDRYPPLPGYTGHIPHVYRSAVVGRSVASATRRERERASIAEAGRTQDKSLERYQEQTASSRAKQVRITKPHTQPPSHEQQNTVTDTLVTVTIIKNTTNEAENLSSSVKSSENFVVSCDGHVSVRDESAVKKTPSPINPTILAGQIRCTDCEPAGQSRPTTARFSERPAEMLPDTKGRSSSAESQIRSTSLRSTIQKSVSMNVTQRDALTSSRSTNLAKNTSPSKRGKKALDLNTPPRSTSRSKSIDPKTSTKSTAKSSVIGSKLKTITTQTSYQKDANPSVTTQTSVEPKPNKKGEQVSGTTVPKKNVSVRKESTYVAKEDKSKYIRSSTPSTPSKKNIVKESSDETTVDQTVTSCQEIQTKMNPTESSGPKSYSLGPAHKLSSKFEARVNLDAANAKEAQVI